MERNYLDAYQAGCSYLCLRYHPQFSKITNIGLHGPSSLISPADQLQYKSKSISVGNSRLKTTQIPGSQGSDQIAYLSMARFLANIPIWPQQAHHCGGIVAVVDRQIVT